MSEEDKENDPIRKAAEEALRALFGDNYEEQMKKLRGENPDSSADQSPFPFPFGGKGDEPFFFSNDGMSGIMMAIPAMFSGKNEGNVNWKIGEQAARAIIQEKGESAPTAREGEHYRAALSNANWWLDSATGFDPVKQSAKVMSRSDWAHACLPVFRQLTEPVGENISREFSRIVQSNIENMPEELASQLGNILVNSAPMIISMAMGVKFGQGLGEIACQAFSTSDCGIPLVEGERVGFVSENITNFARDLDIPLDDIAAFLAVREQAYARLYGKNPWLRAHLLDTVTAYARDIHINVDFLEEQVRSMGENLVFSSASMPTIDLSDIFTGTQSAYQKDLLNRLEHLMSLVDGWVNTVTLQAASATIEKAVPLSEMITRRAATGSPLNAMLELLMNLEVHPRKIREAGNFWMQATHKLGIEGRDALWKHPDLLPTPEHIDNPDAFFAPQKNSMEDELDAFLNDLLTQADEEGKADEEGETPSE